MLHRVETILSMALGCVIGFKFADIDQILPFLTHRSILTHGFLIPLALAFRYRQRYARSGSGALRLQSLLAGTNAAIAVHLAFDLFPSGWYQHALISIPFYGWTSPLFSIVWIAFSVVTCLCIAVFEMQDKLRLLLTCSAVSVVFWYAAAAEPDIALMAATVLLVGCAISVRISQWYKPI